MSHALTPALTPAIAVHLVAASAALVLGAIVLSRRKGTAAHRLLGRLWVGTMVVTAAGSFWIRTGGGFSWIHLLSAWTLVAVSMGFWHIRRARIDRHRGWMVGAYVGLAVAAAFTLLPNRLLGHLVRAWLG
ncbi:MAG TPA: DUF2306 domain-containing protein [Burkholderiales bacterium]